MTDHDKRVYHHMYETGEGILEHAERIAKLEELVRDIYEMAYYEHPSAFETAFADRMRELGLVVE